MMRVVSQNGMIDIPYEMSTFHCAGGIIRINMSGGDAGKGTVMAQYDTEEKVQKAMEMLHKAYTGIMPSIVIGNDSSFGEEDMKVLQNSTIGAFIKPANYGDVEVHILPRIFRFPEDDEIEVGE